MNLMQDGSKPRRASPFNTQLPHHNVITFVLLLLSALCLFSCRKVRTAEVSPLVVSAASDLTPAFEEIGKRFEKETGIKVVFNFGSTGQLAQQIKNGAPVDLFAAANMEYIDALEKSELLVSGTKGLYARGRLVLWTRADSRLQIARIEDLTKPEVKRISIANPDHAPYGVAAKQALETAGIWGKVQKKLVSGENIRQAHMYGETGNVDVALSALSLSTQSRGKWMLIPENLHKELNQGLAVIRTTKREKEARQFAEFINGSVGRPIMKKYGFLLPGEKSTADR